MEFIDPVVVQEELASNEKPHDQGNTEKAVNQLEEDIDKAYTVVEKRFAELWTSASKNAEGLQEKYKFDERKNEILKQLSSARENIGDKAKVTEHLAQFETQLKGLGEQFKDINISDIKVPEINLKNIGKQANTYLDSLDNQLEKVEQQAGAYVNKFASFLGGFVSITSDSQSEGTYEKETLFSSPLDSSNYGTSRYETDLFKLHTTPEMYLNDELDNDNEFEKFNVDNKTKDISQLLDKYDSTLRKLMNELVPVKIAYNVFWFRYFKLEDELKAQDLKRKQLLDSKDKTTENEEDFTWDEDEDGEEAIDIGDDSDIKKSSKQDEEEDDDWE